MAYVYNSENKQLDLLNPFKVENFFYFLAAFIILSAAIGLLLISRSALSAHITFMSILPLLIGVALLLLGIWYANHALRQLRFFFGRGEPANLADEIAATQTGKGAGADILKDNLRHNALAFAEPKGALNGLLYSWIPHLIFSPRGIQEYAQYQFYNALAIIAILLSLLVSWVSFGLSSAASWMGLFYYTFTLVIVIKSLRYGAKAQSELGVWKLVVLVVIAILGPVTLPMISSNWADISSIANFNLQAFMLLTLSLVVITLFFIALTKQLVPPPATTASCKQMTLSMNAHPKQLLDEMDRELQSKWTVQIPNRRHIKLLPEINSGAGEFLGGVVRRNATYSE